MRNLGILVFEDVEVLDFAGPFEVFAVTSELNNHELFNVFLVAEETGPLQAVNGLTVLPAHDFSSAPDPDILVIAGGAGSRRAMENGRILGWVRRVSQSAELVMSVCSGARILARAGLLTGLSVTTHHEVLEHLRELAPDADVRSEQRIIDTGRVITTGGISAGIDGSFHVVDRLFGPEIAARTARYMEYDWPRAVASTP